MSGKKLNKKGFSLVELLATIIIIGVISTIAIAGVSRHIANSKAEKANQSKKNVAMSAKLYLQSNRQMLPRMIGEATLIPFSELRNSNYLKEDVTNANGEDCMEKSFVRVYMLDEDEYSYTTYLYCGNDEVPDEPDVPDPVVYDFEFSAGGKKNAKLSDVKDARFDFKMKGAEKDDTVGIYSYTYTIFVRNSTSGAYTEVYNSGVLKGGLEPNVAVSSKPLSSYMSLTGYNSVRVDVVVINEQGGKLEFTTTSGEYEDTDPPICGNIEGQAKDDEDWVNKDTLAANGNIPDGQLRAYPGRVSVYCSDKDGSGCKRDKFTRSWPNNSDAVSEIKNYKLGARWSYVLLEDNAEKVNTTKCYVRANVDVQAPDVTVKVYNAKSKKLIKTFNVKDEEKVNSKMPEGVLAANQYDGVTGTGDEKWLNLETIGTTGIYIDVDIKDNLYLYSYEWKVNKPYVAGGTLDDEVASTASFDYVQGEGTTTPYTNTFKSEGMTDNPKNDNELKTAEHGALSGSIKNLKIVREGKRYAELKVCDKAKNCTTVHIYVNIDITPPLVPKTSYEKINSKAKYDPANVSNYQDHNHWSNEYVRPYVEGQRDDKETQEKSIKVELSGWDQFKYIYKQQTDKVNGTYKWDKGTERSIGKTSSGGRYGFDITDEGTHIVTFRSCDRAGNCSEYSVDDYVKVDTIKPTCEIVTKYAGVDSDKIKGEVKNKSIGSSNGSGWLKLGQTVTLSHSCEDKDDRFSSSCNGSDYHNKQSYLFNKDIKTEKAGANGFNSTYGAQDNTAGGHVVDYAGNMSDECPKMRVQIDYTIPTCKTNITWPEGKPTNPDTPGKAESGWLGLVNGVGPGKKTAKIAKVCTDPLSNASAHMAGVHSTCDDAGKYDSTKMNQVYHIYGEEMWITNGGAEGTGKGGKVIDVAGNIGNCPADRTVKIDYTKPVCTTNIDYGIGANASSYSKNGSIAPQNPKSENGWLGYYSQDNNSTKKMARVIQKCEDKNGIQKSGCYGDMKYFVYDYQLVTDKAGARGVGDNGFIYDRAMNETNCSTPGNWHTVKIDYTRPVCKVSISSKGSYTDVDKKKYSWSYTAYDGRWLGKNSSVTINSTCTTDEAKTGQSGCATDENKVYKTEINTTEATTGGDGKNYYVWDLAGNRAKDGCAKKTVKIDLTGPICSVETRSAKVGKLKDTSPLYDANEKNDTLGWLPGTMAVRVLSWCSDDKLANKKDGSGCSETKKHTNDYSTKSGTVLNDVKGSKSNGAGWVIKDNVGNTTTCGKLRIKIDYQKPTCPITMRTSKNTSYANNTWTNADYVTVTRSCDDKGGSGCREGSGKKSGNNDRDCKPSSSVANTYTYPAEKSGHGVIRYDRMAGADGKNCHVTVYDLVGNSIECASNKTIKIDQEPPSCKITKESHVNGKWTSAKKPAVVEATCDDKKGSGCVKKYFTETIAYDYNASYTFANHTAKDNAGNEKKCEEKTYKSVKVQSTPPSCTVIKDNHGNWSPDGVPVSIVCDPASTPSPSAEIKSCASNGRRIQGSRWGGTDTTKSTPSAWYTVTDVVGNSARCHADISRKTEYTSATCKTCSSCDDSKCTKWGKQDCNCYWDDIGRTSGTVCQKKGGDIGTDGDCYVYKCSKCDYCVTHARDCEVCKSCDSTLSYSKTWSDYGTEGWSGKVHTKSRYSYR